jgi:hypothetical protein
MILRLSASSVAKISGVIQCLLASKLRLLKKQIFFPQGPCPFWCLLIQILDSWSPIKRNLLINWPHNTTSILMISNIFNWPMHVQRPFWEAHFHFWRNAGPDMHNSIQRALKVGRRCTSYVSPPIFGPSPMFMLILDFRAWMLNYHVCPGQAKEAVSISLIACHCRPQLNTNFAQCICSSYYAIVHFNYK